MHELPPAAINEAQIGQTLGAPDALPTEHMSASGEPGTNEIAAGAESNQQLPSTEAAHDPVEEERLRRLTATYGTGRLGVAQTVTAPGIQVARFNAPAPSSYRPATAQYMPSAVVGRPGGGYVNFQF